MIRSRATALRMAICGVLAATPAAAQFVDVPAFLAGTPSFAKNLQEVDVAPSPDGGFVLVWGEFNDTLGSTNAIVTRRFGRDGQALAPPVRIDSTGWGLYPTITAADDGAYIGAWMWSKPDVARALYARRLDTRAHASLGEVRVDTPSSGPMVAHAAAWLADGPLYFWKQNGLWVRGYDRYGAPLGDAVKVADNTPAFDLDVDALPDGGFAVAWSNLWLADHSWARVYRPDRTPLTDAFAIETVGIVDEVVAGPAGVIAMVGHANFDDTNGGALGPRSETWLRRFSADGQPVGERMVVATGASDVVMDANAAYDAHGNLLVVWRDYDETAGWIARGRAYDAGGTELGPAFVVAAQPVAEIHTVTLADGCFANAWYASSKAYADVVCLCGAAGGGAGGCGDGQVDPRCETCDDGNSVEGDGCDSNCTLSGCGNGVVGAAELCDDGNRVSGDGCDVNCTPTACGNGVVTAGEQCDDGNSASDDGCDADCRPSGCGNGTVAGNEECDDGNLTSGDGCDVDCTLSRCGNGIAAGGEACDDGNSVDGDGCDSDCSLSACGNGVVAGDEECDDGDLRAGDGCDGHCLIETCGDGRIEGLEECDDGNSLADDDCNPDCTMVSKHDSVVLAVRPVQVSIPAGQDPAVAQVIVHVKNADSSPVREVPGHAIRLEAFDGDCPAGTISRAPDFDRGADGVQDVDVVGGGNPATAIAEVSVSRAAFTPFDRRMPARCTLWLRAEEASGTSQDPTPDNNFVAVELNVSDTVDTVHGSEDEFFVESMKPITLKIPPGLATISKRIKPVVRRASDLPADAADLTVTVAASDGDCPAGTVGYLDFDRRKPGYQDRLTLRRGRRVKGSLGIVIRAADFTSPSDDAPRRCTILVTASGDGDTDPGNNVTRLVLDIIDRNDF